MELRAYEKKGIFILTLLLFLFFLLPYAFSIKENPYFILVAHPQTDTSILKVKSYTKPEIELNSADSIELMKIKGIGPYYANKIIRYRERLGGFYSLEQLREIEFQYTEVDSLLPYLFVNKEFIRKSQLESMNFRDVLKHPYLEYEDVQLIFQAKKKFNTINISILEKEKVLPEYKLRKIRPYFQ